MRILLVEDHKELAQLLTSGLTRDGYACDVAASLRQAQEALDVAPYSAMILDLGLPDGDGLDWLADKRRQSLPVRRQNIWLRSRRRIAECGPRLVVDVRRQACGVASADIRWSVV